MTKRIILSVLLVLVAVAGFWLYKKRSSDALTKPLGDYSQPAGTVTALTAGASSDPAVQAAWQVFQDYLAAAKAHDIAALRKNAYKLSPTCANSAKQAECFAVMDRVYKAGSTFKESDFTNAVYDARQIILSTNWRLEESDAQVGYGREVIYFTRTSGGIPHILFFTQPEEIIYSFIDPKIPHSSLISRLNDRIRDTDGDMLEDEYETCSYQGAASSTPACVPTDPRKMDSDGNGWWDSIEQYLK